ncbi:MAG TPA: hypothetical protein VKE96_30755 [Vicinamibacterales bacterium]|nr:hypothetical protein [Vicinamibacterales bacterium]
MRIAAMGPQAADVAAVRDRTTHSLTYRRANVAATSRDPYMVVSVSTMADARTLASRTTLRAYARRVDWSVFRSAVSLHAHTNNSREVLSDLPSYIVRIPLLGRRFNRELDRRRLGNEPVDFTKGWWHPPVTAREVFDSEADQIDRRFGIDSIVSITDHDDVAAGLEAQRLYAVRRAPVSVEWTVPYENGFFHLGVHNLPESGAAAWLARLTAFTRRHPTDCLRDILDDLHASHTLIVLNHPLWDLAGVGERMHTVRLRAFLDAYHTRLHALEVNGYRSRHENGGVRRASAERGVPLISGGDRHALAPNAVLNLTRAGTFAEFAAEIRDGVSHIVVMPEYRHHLAGRILGSAADVLGSYRVRPDGWQRWFDRVSCEWNGQVRPLSYHWPDGGPLWVRSAICMFRVFASPLVRPTWSAALRCLDGPAPVSPIPAGSWRGSS